MKKLWLPWTIGMILFCLPVHAGYEEPLRLGILALKGQNQEQAITYFEQVIDASDATHAQYVTAFSGRCAAYYRQSFLSQEDEQRQRAIEDCSQAITRQADHQHAYRLRGTVHLTMKNWAQALSDLNVAVALDPQDVLSRQNRGLVKANMDHFEDAMDDFSAAIHLNPNHPWSYYNRGQLYAAQNNHNKAIADFNAFIRLKQDYAPAYRHRGQSWMLSTMYHQAVTDFHKALQLRPTDNTARSYRGITLFLLGHYTEAEKDLRAAVMHSPEDLEYRVWLFLALEWQKRPSQEAFSDADNARDPEQWPDVVSSLLLNKTRDEFALKVAQKTEDPVQRQKRENIILFILGERALRHNLPHEAKHWLQKIGAAQDQISIIQHAAQHRLQKLNIRKGQWAYNLFTINAPKPYPRVAPTIRPPQKPTPDLTYDVAHKVEYHATETIPNITPESVPEEIARRRPPATNTNFGLTREAISEIDFLASRGIVGKRHAKGKFSFMLGSFQNSANADRVLGRVSRTKIPVYIQEVDVNERAHIRVWAGPFTNYSAATRAHKKARTIPGITLGPVNKF